MKLPINRTAKEILEDLASRPNPLARVPGEAGESEERRKIYNAIKGATEEARESDAIGAAIKAIDAGADSREAVANITKAIKAARNYDTHIDYGSEC